MVPGRHGTARVAEGSYDPHIEGIEKGERRKKGKEKGERRKERKGVCSEGKIFLN